MLSVKDGVQPKLVHLLAGLANVSERLHVTLTITACIDGVHSANSLHYALRAVDVRSRGLDFPQATLEAIQKELGPQFQCLYENVGTPNEHFHIEFDPQVR